MTRSSSLLPTHNPPMLPMLVQKKRTVIQIILATVKPKEAKYTILTKDLIKIMIEDVALLKNQHIGETTGTHSTKISFNELLILLKNRQDQAMTNIKLQTCKNQEEITPNLMRAKQRNNVKHAGPLAIRITMNVDHCQNTS